MEDTDFDVEVPLLFDQGYECSQNQEVEAPCSDDVGVKSLDYRYEPIYNVVKLKSKKLKRQQYNRKLYGYTGLTLAKWTITIVIGLLVGLIAFIIEYFQEVIIIFKVIFGLRIVLDNCKACFCLSIFNNKMGDICTNNMSMLLSIYIF